MNIIKFIPELRTSLDAIRKKELIIGFVPTMGNLHDGHLRLVKAAQEKCDYVVVSIFVNPMQFGPNEDFDSYPRTFDEDCSKLNAINADCIFVPTIDDIYPNGKEVSTFVELPVISKVLCGASRPTFFNGICTVVTKLFNMVQPNMAFFGKKDFQQYTILKQMTADLNMPIEIVGVDTIRVKDGLALSSRNQYLNDDERQLATTLIQMLTQTKKSIENGNKDFEGLSQEANKTLSEAGFTPDYFEVRRTDDLALASDNDTELTIFAAAKLGKARLIDNVQVTL